VAFWELLNSDSQASPGGGVAAVTLSTLGADLIIVHMAGWFGEPALTDSEGITGWAGPGSSDSVSNTCKFKFGGATSATHTFTATGGNWPSISVMVFRGGVSGDTANQQNAATSGVATITAGPTSPGAPVGNNHLVISTLTTNVSGAATVSGTNVSLAVGVTSGWVVNQAMHSHIAWGVQSSSAVVTAQWNWTGNSSCAASIITFVPGDPIPLPDEEIIVEIEDVEINNIIEDPGRKGINIDLSLGSNWTCEFDVYDPTTTTLPELRDDVDVFYAEQHIFEGDVISLRNRPRSIDDTDHRTTVTSKANQLIIDQLKVIGFTAPAGETLEELLAALIAHGDPSLADEGVTLDAGMDPGPTVTTEVTFDGISYQEAFNDLSRRTLSLIRLMPGLILEAFAPGDMVCEYALTTANGFALAPVTWTRDSTQIVNRVTQSYGEGTATLTDSFTGDGVTTTFTLSASLDGYLGYTATGAIGYAVVNYGAGTESLGGASSGLQWTYNPATKQITRTAGAPPAATAISVKYDTHYPQTVTVEDSASITADGLWHVIAPARPDVLNLAEATDIATGLLHTSDPQVITVRTKQYPMPFPGDVINLDFAARDIANDDYLITRVRATDYKLEHMEFTLTCVSGTQGIPFWKDQIRKLLGV
jgi:hypothetical protein